MISRHCPVCDEVYKQLKRHLIRTHDWRYYDGINPEPPRFEDMEPVINESKEGE